MTLHFALPSRRLPLGMFLLLVTTIGCTSDYLETEYGTRAGFPKNSVNGTIIFSDLLTAEGHRVRSWPYLSPSLKEADVLVWFPDHFHLPDHRVQRWLLAWLRDSDSPKHLIFVGRGYDAAITYWQTVAPLVPQSQRIEAQSRLNRAKNNFNILTSAVTEADDWGDWVHTNPQAKPLQVQRLSGNWAKGIDTSQVQIQRSIQLQPTNRPDRVLLRGDGKPLVSQFDIFSGLRIKSSRITIIDNGSFLLNAALVNHEHRKLTAHLIADLGAEPKRIVFLEPSDEQPRVLDEEPGDETPTGFELFGVWPLNGMLLHLGVLGALFAMSRWPIFGLPRDPTPPALTDFGRHVRALGGLLRKSGDTDYADRTLKTYQQQGRRDA